MRESLRVLNLGAGVQSTAIYLMMCDGEIEPADVAIFSDVQSEPASVYEHLERLKSIGGPEIVTVTAGSLEEDLLDGVNTSGSKFVSIPSFLITNSSSPGIGKRQCTREYKVAPIEKEIRRRMGAIGKPLKPDQSVTQVMGLSFDEPRRVERVKARNHGRRGWHVEFPLFDDMMTRADCVRYLDSRWDHPVPRSACVFCPYKTDQEWQELKTSGGADWDRAVAVDEAIRLNVSGSVSEDGGSQYLHHSCVPLSEVKFKPAPTHIQPRFQFGEMDCEGMCGM